jgi:nitrogen fixation protein NifU and related proteins
MADSAEAANDTYFGRMNAPTVAAAVRGPCGDQMEMYLLIEDGIIEEIRCCTDGCGYTRAFGTAVARRASGLSVREALGISALDIIDAERQLPREGRHCAILAVSTLYRAIAQYMLQR